MENKYFYKCTDCSKEYQQTETKYLCPVCEKKNSANIPPKGVLKTIYDYLKIKSNLSPNDLINKLVSNNFMQLLPIESEESLSMLQVGDTPAYIIDSIEDEQLPFEIVLKDDSQNPSFSFKDRASQIVSAWALENSIDTIVAASTGNAGSSLACICAAQMQKAIIFVPASAPRAKLTQIVMYGAKIIPVDGTYDDAFDLSIAATKKFGWYNRNTGFNPLTIEGKKTVSFELFQQLGNTIPDRIFVPVGDGVIISGVYKGFEDLLNLGLIDKMPVIVAVQAEGSNNIIRNIETNDFDSKPGNTIADSISVDIPRNFYMAKGFLLTYGGEYISVSDKEIQNASKILSQNTGIFSEPAAAASFAGLLKFKELGKIPDGTKNVVLLTGSGLKDLKSVQDVINIPKPIKPDINNLSVSVINQS